MRRGVKAFEDSNWRDQFAWLLLRVIAELSPCTSTSLIAHVSGGDPASERGRAPADSHARKLIFDALLKLEILDFIQSAQDQIAITDKGRQRLHNLRPRTPYFAVLRTLVPTLLAEYIPRLKRFCQHVLAAARLVTQQALQLNGDRALLIVRRARESALQIWKRKVAPIIGARATTLVDMLTQLARLCGIRAQAWDIVLGNWRRQASALLWTCAKASRRPQRAKLAGCGWLVISAGALLVVALSIAGGVTLLPDERAESSQLVGSADASRSPADAVEPDAPATLIARAEAIGTTAPSDIDQKPAETAATEPSSVEQQPADSPGATPGVTEQTPTDPIIATIRSMLTDPALRRGVASEDLAALQSFYAERNGPPLWMAGTGFSPRAQAAINEIQDADDWGLPSEAFDLPPADDVPATTEAQATDEIKLGVAILKYARFARGGRVSPSRISVLLDQRPSLRDPKTVLTEIGASAAPDAYLRSLHPKHEQFERLRQALTRARANSEARGRKPGNEPGIQRLIVNMERWRWMPAELGAFYVWNNVPEFTARVIKHGKSIYVEKTVVGQLKYATPIFSANMRAIVFNPEWVVPETIKLEDLQPRLRQVGFFGVPDTSILREHQLSVSYQGRPIDASTVDWGRANILQYTFTQPPGPDNVLGTLKFNFPNRYAIYMHDTVQPEFFDETVRTLSHGCIRVRQPDRLAQLLLAEDKGWSGEQVKSMLATGNNTVVTLNRPIPVHLTYFTAVVDEQGKLQTFADVYGLDSKIGSALFGKALKSDPPMLEASTQSGQRTSSFWRSAERSGDLTDSILGLFGN